MIIGLLDSPDSFKEYRCETLFHGMNPIVGFSSTWMIVSIKNDQVNRKKIIL